MAFHGLGWVRRSVVEGGDVEMALFSKESKHTQSEQVKEASQSPGAQAFQSPAREKTAAGNQAASPSVRQVYLDRDSKVEGKLNFKRSVRIDGQIDGEILAKDLIIGESALVTA